MGWELQAGTLKETEESCRWVQWSWQVGTSKMVELWKGKYIGQ